MIIKQKLFIKRILITTFVFLTLFNFIYSSGHQFGISFANLGSVEISPEAEGAYDGVEDVHTDGAADGASWATKYIIIPIFTAVENVLISLSVSGGLNEEISPSYITPLDIFFNKFKIIDINIFSLSGLDQDSFVYKIRANIALWYGVFLAIAVSMMIIILLINLIVILGKSTSSSEKAIAKIAIKNWLVSLILIIFINLFMIAIINLSQVLIDAIANVLEVSSFGNVIDSLSETIFSANYSLGLSAVIIYVIIICQTAIFFVRYIQRFLTILVLAFTAPLIPVSYSLDKTSGENSMTLKIWAREFLYNVFLQPLDCLLYAGIAGVALGSLGTSFTKLDEFGPALLAILTVLFIPFAEKLVREILGFNNTNTINNNVLKDAVFTTARNVKKVGNAVLTAGSMMIMPGAAAVKFGVNVKEKGAEFVSDIGKIRNGELSGKQYMGEKLLSAKNTITSGLKKGVDKITDFDPQAASKKIGLTEAIDKSNGKNRKYIDNKEVSLNEQQLLESSEDTVMEAIADDKAIKKKEQLDMTEKDLHIVAGSNLKELDNFKKKFRMIDKNNQSKKIWNDFDKKELYNIRELIGSENAEDIESFVENLLTNQETGELDADMLTDKDINERFLDETHRKYAQAYKDFLLYEDNRMKKGALIEEFNDIARMNGGRTISSEEAKILKDAQLKHDGSPDILDTMLVGTSIEEKSEISENAKLNNLPEEVYSLISHYNSYTNSITTQMGLKSKLEQVKDEIKDLSNKSMDIKNDIRTTIEANLLKIKSREDFEKYADSLNGAEKDYAMQYGSKVVDVLEIYEAMNVQEDVIKNERNKLQADLIQKKNAQKTLFNKTSIKEFEDIIEKTYKANGDFSKDDINTLKSIMSRTIDSLDMGTSSQEATTEEIKEEITEKTRILNSSTNVSISNQKLEITDEQEKTTNIQGTNNELTINKNN